MAEGQLGEVPTWIQYLIGALALLITGVATRLGYTAKDKSNSSGQVELAGGIVDQKAAKAIVESLDSNVGRMQKMHRERLDSTQDFKEEIKNLSQDIRALTREVTLLVERMR